jgi:S1-C subfamily serine protease
MGVFIGGGAVWLGLEERQGIDSAGHDGAAMGVLGGADAGEADTAGHDDAATHRSALVESVAETRDAVVNLETAQGRGAGVIVDPRGVVVTNFHVIADALEAPREGLFGGSGSPAQPVVTARFENDRTVAAEVVLADAGEDLAVLRLLSADSAEQFTAAKLGSSSALQVGQEVYAIGNPVGLPHTVTRGIVSALDRTGILDNRRLGVIQLDAAINIGNSGGPLFNMRGELVGIVAGRQKSTQGIAFALPIDHVHGFLRAASDPDAARWGVIGVSLDLDRAAPTAALALGYEAGLRVQDVLADGPAARAGMHAGDMVVALRGKRLDGLPKRSADAMALHLQTTVRSMFPGETLPITVVRAGSIVDLDVEIGSASERDQVFIDAEELLGLLLDRTAEHPIIVGIRASSPLFRDQKALTGTRVVRLMQAPIENIEGFGEMLDKLRRLVRKQGAEPTVLIAFRDQHGREAEIPIRVW